MNSDAIIGGVVGAVIFLVTITAISVMLFFYFKRMTTKRDGEYQNHGVIRYNIFTAIHI